MWFGLSDLLVDIALLAGQCRQVGGYAGGDEALVDAQDALGILRDIVRYDGEVETEATVELHVDEAGSNDTATKIDDVVGDELVLVKYFLAVQDLARHGAEPQILVDELVAFDDTAIGKLCDTAGLTDWGGGYRHGDRGDEWIILAMQCGTREYY